MDWITSQIAIGNYLDALDGELLRREGLQSALSLDATLHGRNPAEFGLRRIEVVSLEDAPGNDPRLFRRAIDYLVELVFNRRPYWCNVTPGGAARPWSWQAT